MNEKRKLGELASDLGSDDLDSDKSQNEEIKRTSATRRAATGLIGGDDYLRNRDFKTILEVDPARVRISPRHDRLMNFLTAENTRELIESIRAKGQIEPAIARPVKGEEVDYEVIAGARRWWVAAHLGIKLRIEIQDITDSNAFEINWASNRRSDISDYEAARYIVYGLKTHYAGNQREMERALGISHQKIGRYQRMTEIPQKVIEALEDPRQLTLDHAERLLKYINKPQTNKAVLREAVKLSKREELLNARRLVARLLETGKKEKSNDGATNTTENWFDEQGVLVATVTSIGGAIKIKIPRTLADMHRAELDRLMRKMGLQKEAAASKP